MKKFLAIFSLIFFLITNTSYGGDEVIKNILSNKATVLYKETSGLGIIAGTIFIKGGSVEDPEGKKGLTTLTMKTLLKGTKKYSSFDINKVFEDSGGYISTSTSDDYVIIEFALRTDDFKEAMKILKSVIFEPIFPENQIEIEKTNLISSIKAKKEDAFSYAFDKLRREMYKGTPYQYPPYGEIDDIKTITKKDIQNRWNELLEGSRWVISFVGDLPYSQTEETIKEVFNDIPSKTIFKYPHYEKEIIGESCKTFQRDGAQSTILVAYNAPTYKDKYYFAMKVLNGILGDGFTSRLFQELREKQGLAYAVGSFFPTRINMGRLIAYIGTAPQNTERALKGIREVVNSIGKGVSDEELKTAKEKIIGSFLLDHQTRAKQSWYLGWFETIGFGYEMDKKYTEYINKVKKSDVIEAYKTYLTKGNLCVIVKP